MRASAWHPDPLRLLLLVGAVSIPAAGFMEWQRGLAHDVFAVRVLLAGICAAVIGASYKNEAVRRSLQPITFGVLTLATLWFLLMSRWNQFGFDDLVGLMPLTIAGALLCQHRAQLLALVLGTGVWILVLGVGVDADVSPPVFALLLCSVGTVTGIAALDRASLLERLADNNQRLEAEVARRTHDLQLSLASLRDEIATREQAERLARAASEAKSAFLSAMSHELRTPLTAIMGYASLIEEELDDDPSTDPRPDLARVRRSAAHLLHLIDQILDLSRIERGELEVDLRPVALRPLADEAVALSAMAAHTDRAVDVDIPDDLQVLADRDWLRQVLIDLVGNALKFAERGRVQLQGGPDDDDRCRLTIRDQGEGIPPDALQRIFEPFQQVDNSPTRVHGGAGLGLAISHRLARLMNGELTVESAVGEGSTFTLQLPLAQTGPAGDDAA